MTTFAQLRDRGEDPIAIFEQLFRAALKSLLSDLAKAPWYVREREVVNLFVFSHLIPQFQEKNLDISQLGIEVPVQKLPKSIEATVGKPAELPLSPDKAHVLKPSKQVKEARGKYADIVVWPHAEATLWQTCRLLVHIEWKHISCRTPNPPNLEQAHADDICLLKHNRTLVCVSYAILTEWHPFKHEWHMGQRDRYVEAHCKRIVVEKEPEDFFSLRVAATCPESAITVLQGPHAKVRSRPQACPVCIPNPSAVPFCGMPSI
jgi:hypothetical protein